MLIFRATSLKYCYLHVLNFYLDNGVMTTPKCRILSFVFTVLTMNTHNDYSQLNDECLSLKDLQLSTVCWQTGFFNELFFTVMLYSCWLNYYCTSSSFSRWLSSALEL